MFFIIFSFFCFSYINAQETVLFNLVHGTWAKKSTWHKEQGHFFKTLKSSATQTHAIPTLVSINSFEWSGKLSHESRVKAGKHLAYLIKKLPVDTKIHIIAHSHGANVVFVASEILAQEKSKNRIETCFLLGAPINIKWYNPCMEKISYIYNMFSFKDCVQTVFGSYERVLPEHERIFNLQITINGKQPGHSELISQTVATWLPSFHELYQKQEDFKLCSGNKPGIVHFFDHQKPVYALDKNQKKSLEYDKKIQKKLFENYCKDTLCKGIYPQKETITDTKNEDNFFKSILNQAFLLERQWQELNKDA
jgi:hypothetical protein